MPLYEQPSENVFQYVDVVINNVFRSSVFTKKFKRNVWEISRSSTGIGREKWKDLCRFFHNFENIENVPIISGILHIAREKGSEVSPLRWYDYLLAVSTLRAWFSPRGKKHRVIQKMHILSLVITISNRYLLNWARRTGLTRGIRIWSQILQFLKMTVNFWEIKNSKSEKNGHSKKSENKGSKKH